MSTDETSLAIHTASADALAHPDLEALRDEAREVFEGATSENTRLAYRKAWAAFDRWCGLRGLSLMPASPEVVVLYLTDLARDHKLSTVRLHLTAINAAHRAAGLALPGDFPPMRTYMRGLAKRLGSAPSPKRALTPEQLAAMVSALDLRTLIGLRDRAVLLLGLPMAARRSELVALDVEDVEEHPRGLRVRLRFSKTDQQGEGELLGIPRTDHPIVCPVLAVAAWLDAAGHTSGPLFRAVSRHGRLGEARLDGRAVARIVKAGVARIGLDPVAYAGHSLRSGLATAAAEEGVEERRIMAQTRHTSERMVRRYIHEGALFRDNAATPVLDRIARAAKKP